MGLGTRVKGFVRARGNMPPLFLSSLVDGTAFGMMDLVWQPLVISLGGTIPVIGIFNSVGIGVTSLLELGTGELCDSLGRKKMIAFFYVLSVAGVALTLMAGSWIYLLPSIILIAVADSLGEPAFSPIFAESVDEKNVGIAFSIMSLTWWIPGFYSQLIAGFLGDSLGIRLVLAISLALETLALLLFVVFVQETLKERKRVDLGKIISSIKGSLVPLRGLTNFYALSILERFAWALSNGIFIAMLYRSTGFSLLQIGGLTTIASAITTLTLIPGGKLVDRYGSHLSLRLSAVFSAVLFAGYIVIKGFLPFMALQVVRGVTIALWEPAAQTYLTKSVSKSERGKYFGSLSGLKGLFSIPAPLIGAYLFDSYGFAGTFTASLIVEICVIFFSFRLD